MISKMQITGYIFEIIELFPRDYSTWIAYFNSISDIVNYLMTFVIFLMLLYVFYKIYAFWRLKEIIRNSEDPSNKNSAKSFKSTKDLPLYPNGWIPVLESRDIKIKEVKPVSVLGHELVVFRGISGNVYVLDAFCPHLGANLGYGGRVVQECNQDCIKCPFHGWSFKGKDGVCAKIPDLDFTESQFPNARIRVWDKIERNGFIFIWYHEDGHQPNWFPESIDEIENSKWVYQGRIVNVINSHIQEIAENGSDTTHFFELHTPVFSQFSPEDLFTRFKNFLSNHIHINLISTPNWCDNDPPNQHKANLFLEFKITAFGYKILDINYSIEQIGPAVVHIKYRTYLLGEVEGGVVLVFIPLELNKTKAIQLLYGGRTLMARLISKFCLISVDEMFNRDAYIWNNKKFVKNPIFTKNEKSLVKFRRWYKQFYSESKLQKIDW